MTAKHRLLKQKIRSRSKTPSLNLPSPLGGRWGKTAADKSMDKKLTLDLPENRRYNTANWAVLGSPSSSIRDGVHPAKRVAVGCR